MNETRVKDVDETVYSPTEISDFIDVMNQTELESPFSIRQQIIAEYPRLLQLMNEKNLTRRELYKHLCNKSNVKMGEKTFYTYMSAGKEAMEKREREAAEQGKTSVKIQQQELLASANNRVVPAKNAKPGDAHIAPAQLAGERSL